MTPRPRIVSWLALSILAACGGGSPPVATPPDGGVSGTPDGGSGGGGTGTDAGQVGDAGSGGGGQGGDGSGGGGGGSGGGGGQDGGSASDCDGLVPGTPGAPTEFRWADRDLNSSSGGACLAAETDGTGHVALRWQNPFQPHNTQFAFLDPATGSQAGSYQSIRLLLIGQASGFMGGTCAGANCSQNYVVVDPVGKELFSSPFNENGNGVNANDPTGGMIHVRFSGTTTILLDAIDDSGKIRWRQPLPDAFGPTDTDRTTPVGVDRRGNVLALWRSTVRFGPGTWAGQWFDHDGNAGPVFMVLSGGPTPDKFYERVGDGLFLSGSTAGGPDVWLGQFDAQATSISPPPAWLASRPNTALHMVHGGKGYAVLPASASSPACEQQVEVISPSGQACGSATFSIGGGACTTSSIIVGYDGTVVQQGPRERESCRAADHICTCTYRSWPGFFR